MNVSRNLASLSDLTRQLHDELREHLANDHASSIWRRLAQRYTRQTGNQDSLCFVDAVAQAITCASYAQRSAAASGLPCRARRWLLDQADPLVGQVFLASQLVSDTHPTRHRSKGTPTLRAAGRILQTLDHDTVRSLDRAVAGESSAADVPLHFYEQFLRSYDRDQRRQRGVFYTPDTIVSFIVSRIDRVLRSEFNLADGLLDDTRWQDMTDQTSRSQTSAQLESSSPFVRLLDPAMGTGVFLQGIVRHAYCQHVTQHTNKPACPADKTRIWNQLVEQKLLPRLWGAELMLPALVLAQIQMAVELVATGYQFANPGKLHFYLADTLRQPPNSTVLGDMPRASFSIILGNPPFSGISANREPWIRRLLRGESPDGSTPVANYFQVDERPLSERKHWLEDDYVKFMRFAHWQIERTGVGVVALVTNHAYLDNLTFRGMRQQLLHSFPRMTLVDLHGNQRHGASVSNGPRDEGVFPIEQGVAISLLRSPPAGSAARRSRIDYLSLRGSKVQKLQKLEAAADQSLKSILIQPRSPHYFLVPHDHQGRKEYERGFRLADVMPVHSTVAVTARDALVVAFNERELRTRMECFRDLRLDDQQIRDRFFPRGRSTNYPTGDTRGWRLDQARQRMAACQDWPKLMRSCLYRPFDRRSIFWADWMIDWPRQNIMRQLTLGNNVALIARRQTPAAQPCCYFWVTDTIALDGLIRSDNRGSESVFPLFLQSSPDQPQAAADRASDASDASQHAARHANFSPEFIARCERSLGLVWNESARGRASHQFGPEDLLHYIYALFHSPSYRQRYADWLRIDFPRVFVCFQTSLFRQLAKCGARLLAAHTLNMAQPPTRVIMGLDGSATVETGYPKFHDDHVWINRQARVGPVSEAVWRFRVGTYQVCRKWLKDRRHRTLEATELRQYGQLLDAVDGSLALMRQIDQLIRQHGGWQAAFGLNSR